MNAKRIPQGTRSLILQAALEIVCVYGFAGVTLGNLARKVGMSKSGLFAHFKSIEQVHLALICYAVDDFQSSVISPALDVTEGLPRLQRTVANWLDWACRPGTSSGSPLIAGFFEFDDRDGAVRDSLLEQELAWRTYLGQLVEATIEKGTFRNDLDSEQFVSELCGIYYNFHVVTRFLRKPGGHTTARDTIEALFHRVIAPRDISAD
jgi:AcrR family transcriptional regulator